jgi:hypothetical protein
MLSVAPASAVVVISSEVASPITTVKVFPVLCVGEPESVTLAENSNVDDFVGVPEITPFAFRVKPVGIVPALMLQL